jgi:TRAP-type mannitol/chloroaromatic compound transport system substrate-binding protein
MKMKNLVKMTRRGLLALAVSTATVATFAPTPVQATETINMIAIDGYPARAMWVKEFTGFFIPRVNEELKKTGNYEIKWQEAYGGQIVKPRGVLDGIKLGLGDIGIVTTIFHNSKLPSQGISAVTPFFSADARVVAKAVDEIPANGKRAGRGKPSLSCNRCCVGHLSNVLKNTDQFSC